MPAAPQKSVNPKMAAIVAALLALLAVAVAYVPSLKPVCQSLGGCADEAATPAE